jgi:hypothetical protein
MGPTWITGLFASSIGTSVITLVYFVLEWRKDDVSKVRRLVRTYERCGFDPSAALEKAREDVFGLKLNHPAMLGEQTPLTDKPSPTLRAGIINLVTHFFRGH